MKKIHNKSLGLFILRLVVGAIFLSHGWDKVSNMEGTVAFFGKVGLAPFFAYLVAWVETLGGIALILGVFSRYSALALSVVMVVAIFAVKWKIAYPVGGVMGVWKMAEIDFALLASLLTVVFAGPGHWSILKWCKCPCHKDGSDCKVCNTLGCADCGCCKKEQGQVCDSGGHCC